MRQFSFLHISGKGDIVGEHSLSHLSSYCVLATLAIAAMLTTILIGPIKVDAVQCTVNGRCFRGTSIGENNYGAIVQINTNNIPYMANHASFMLVNSEQNASTQRFAQAGYTVGACAGATAPTLFDEWYDETGYNGACEGPAFSGYHYYYQWRNAYDQWCSGFDGSQCQRYVIAGQNFNMYFGSFLTAYGEVDDTVEVMGGGPGANSGSGYIAEVYYLPSPTSYWVPEPNLGSEYAPCGASPCPYIDSTYYQQQSGHVTVSIYTP